MMLRAVQNTAASIARVASEEPSEAQLRSETTISRRSVIAVTAEEGGRIGDHRRSKTSLEARPMSGKRKLQETTYRFMISRTPLSTAQ